MITREHTWQNIRFGEDYSHMDGPQALHYSSAHNIVLNCNIDVQLNCFVIETFSC